MNFPARYGILLLLLLASLQARAGRKEDSLLNILSKSNDTTRVRIFSQLTTLTYLSDFDKAMNYAKQGLEEAKKIHYTYGEALIDQNLGIIFYYKGEFEKAMKYYIEAQKNYELSGDRQGQAQMDLEIGNLYKKNNDLVHSTEHFRKAQQVFTASDDRSGIANCYNNLGMVQELEHRPDSAIYFYRLGFNTYANVKDSVGMSFSLDYLGGAYLQQKKYDESMRYELQALDIRQRLELKNPVAVSLNNLGELLFEKGDYKGALAYFEKSIELARSIGYRDLAQYSCKYAADCSSKLGDMEKAYHYLSLGAEMKDSIYQENRSRQVAEMQAKYETDKKQKENEILRQQDRIKDLEIEKKQRTIYIVIGIVLLLGALAVLAWLNVRSRQRSLLNSELLKQEQLRNKAIIITQENERKRIAEELHDGIGQMMSAVKLNVAALGSDLEAKNLQFKNALELIDESCRELRSISHNMMPGILVKAGLVPAVKEFTEKISGSGALHIEVSADEEKMRLDELLEVNLFRIIQELINNIVKYAEAKHVQVSIGKEDGEITVMIEDDGKGFDRSVLQTSAGNGWNNIQSRLNLLNGKIEIDSQAGKGTVAFIVVPLSQLK